MLLHKESERNVLLITGATGFVGSCAVRYALRKGSPYGVVVASDIQSRRMPHVPDSKTYSFVQADLTDAKSVAGLVSTIADYRYHHYRLFVWHIGGLFNYSAPPADLFKVNVQGTENLLFALTETFKLSGLLQRFVFWSGGVVYGDFSAPYVDLPATEIYPVAPNNFYGWSKKLAEERIFFFRKAFGLPVTIMRMAAIYGPGSNYGMANAFELQLSGQLSPLLVGDGKGHPALIHVDDVVRVADFLGNTAEAGQGEDKNVIYNVVDDSKYTMDQVSIFLGEHLSNTPFRRFHLPKWVLRRLIRRVEQCAKRLKGKPIIDPSLGEMILLNSWMSNGKLRQLLGYYNRTDVLEYGDSLKGFEATLPWYINRANGGAL